MTKTTFKRLLTIILTLLITFTSVQVVQGIAEETQYPFDQTNVLDDLESAEDFNLIEYPFDKTGVFSPKVVNFVEWCYSVVTTKQDDFALYVYFYNPEGLKIDIASFSNKIQMATKYDSVLVTYDSKPTDYSTFPLIYCNKSERPNYEGLFYKFRIGFTESQRKLLYSRLNSNGRRYDISGITLANVDGTLKEYAVGGTWKFSGYAEGYGVNEKDASTLTCDGCLPLETVTLDVYATTYRTSSSKGANYQNNITSVYFSVPEKYINDYGNLQKIKAEWYEYKTQPVIITDNYTAWSNFLSIAGQEFTTYDDAFGYGIGLGFTLTSIEPVIKHKYREAFNAPPKIEASTGLFGSTVTYELLVDKKIPTIYLPFYNVDLTAETLVSKEALEAYIESYTASYKNGKLPIKNGAISADLFQESIDEHRINLLQNPEDKRGYMVQEIDANDTFNILDYDSTHTKWEKFLDYGFAFKDIETSDKRINVKPIEEMSATLVNKDTFSNLYMINNNDVETAQSFAKNAYATGQIPYIFHFAQTDYFSEKGNLLLRGHIEGQNIISATETVFLDYDIIQLTFARDEVYTVIPVIQTPIDIYSDITFNNSEANIFMAWFCAVVGGILGLAMSIIYLKCLSALLRIKGWARIVIVLLFIALTVTVEYFFTKHIIDVVIGYGGLGFGVMI